METISAPFLRHNVMDRIEWTMLARNSYTAFKHWDMSKLVKKALEEGIATKENVADLFDSYCKYLAIATCVSVDIAPPTEIKELRDLHRTMAIDFTKMCTSLHSSNLLSVPKDSVALGDMYEVVFPTK